MKCSIGILALLLTAANTVSAADVNGEWQLTVNILNDFTYARITLKADGQKLSGNLNEIALGGTVTARSAR